MSANHTLTARLRDLWLELKLWFVAWITVSAMLAASIYLYLQPENGADLWRDYLLARTLDTAGLGSVAVPGWYSPEIVTQFVAGKLPPSVVAVWNRDLALIFQAPVYAIVLMSLAFLVFFDRRD